MGKKAPGKADREGISIIKLMQMFPDNATAEKWFSETRWPDGAHCPHCGSVKVQSGAKHATMPYRCREAGCRKRFSVKVGTCMEGSNLGYQVWAIAIYMLTTNLKGVSSMKLHRDLEITQKAAWHLAHRIRSAWSENGGANFSGPVEVDETFVGGKRKNMPKAKRAKLQGRGSVGKTAVAGAKDRATNQVSAAVIPNAGRAVLHDFVCERTAESAQVYTDDWRSYRGLPRKHESVKHSIGEYVKGQAHTNGIESFWAMLKRGHDGVYHHFSPKHLNRYVGEYAGRHNMRELGTAEQMAGVVLGSVGKQLKYKDLTA